MKINLVFCWVILFLSCTSETLPDIIYTQKQDWLNDFRNGSFPSKALYKNTIYCSSIRFGKDNYLYALNLMTGKVDWATKVKNWATTSPIVNDSLIYYSSYTGDLYRLDLNGKIIWEQQDASIFKDICINPVNGNLLVTTMTNGLLEFAARKGTLIRKYAANSFNISPPIFFDNQMLVSGVKHQSDSISLRGDRLFSFNPENGDTIFHCRIGVTKNLFHKKDRLFFYEEDSSVLVCFSLKEKVRIWTSQKIPNLNSQHIFLSDSNIYCYGSSLNDFFELDFESGKINRKVSYSNLLNEGLIEALKLDYSIVAGDKIWKITVSDSLEAPIPIGSEINVFVK